MDLFAESARAVALHSLSAPVLVFTAGVTSSVGPCVATRFIAVVACGAGARPGRRVVPVFVAGLIAAYGSLGFTAAAFLSRLVDLTSWIYGLVAGSLLLGGAVALARAEGDGDACDCRTPDASGVASYGTIFLLGVSSAFVLSPCCTPLLVTILAYTSTVGDPVLGAALLAVFALGHATPLIVVGLGLARVAERLRQLSLHQATAITSAVLMMALGLFYACLV